MIKHYFFYHGTVNIQGVRNLETLLSSAIREDSPDITVCICSNGGDVCAGIGLYNFIRMIPLSITTYAFGICGSIAATIFLAGERRIAAPVSMFTLHASSYVDGDRKGEICDNTQLISQPFKMILSCQNELPRKYFDSKEEQWLTPNEAQSLKIATEIVDLNMESDAMVTHVNIP